MEFSFPGAFPNQHIELTFNKDFFVAPDFVLVFAFYQEKLLFTHHRERGWELPGGTCNPDEWPVMAAVREIYEETGAELSSLQPIGQYHMHYPHQTREVKTIYVAQVEQIHPLPSGFETDDIQLMFPPPAADSILISPEFSLLLKDDVYRHSLPIALAMKNRF